MAIMIAITCGAYTLPAVEGPPLTPAPKGWPEAVRTTEYPARADASRQPMLVYTAKSREERPLLVGLHTWSGGYKQAGGETVYARWCIEKDWHFIHPHFRGPNWTAEACGSERAVQDILDAVAFMQETAAVDADRIYLVGVSGGGHAALLLAGRSPTTWAGVSAWVPISDLHAWWRECKGTRKYAAHIERAVGGNPDTDKRAAAACIKRSPLNYLDRAAGLNLDINAGVTDGHQGGSVPFSHSLHAFNRVVPERDRIALEHIEAFYKTQALPKGLSKASPDPLYGEKQPIFRKVSSNTRVTIFDGRHEILHEAALNWLAHQRRNKPAEWDLPRHNRLRTKASERASGN
ncbi:MAG: prolyl oligopeptidase family serine peptidase [Verrucomicrobiota bacterium]